MSTDEFPGGLYNRKTNDRWKWMAAASAATVSSAAFSRADAQTANWILLSGDGLSNNGNYISLDVTSGHPFGTVISTHRAAFGPEPLSIRNASMKCDFAGELVQLFASYDKGHRGSFFYRVGRIDSQHNSTNHGTRAPVGLSELIPVTLSDPNIRSGTTVDGPLEVSENMFFSSHDAGIYFGSIYYPTTGTAAPALTINPATGAVSGETVTYVGYSEGGVYTAVVPEPASLSLLAMGAAGVMAFRQRREKAKAKAAPAAAD